MIILSIIEGMLAGAGALVLEMIIQILVYDLYSTSIAIQNTSPFFIVITALVEEIFKYLFIINKYSNLRKKANFIGASMAIGFGFFFLELIFKLSALKTIASLSLLGIVIIHLLTAFLAGFFIQKYFEKNRLIFLPILILNTLIHLAYNLFVLVLP